MSFKLNSIIVLGTVLFFSACKSRPSEEVTKRPNILFAIADDQSFGADKFRRCPLGGNPGLRPHRHRGHLFQELLCRVAGLRPVAGVR